MEKDYLFIFKLLLILSKIIPSDIDLPSYVTKMYDEIKSRNPSLIFTEQYLLNRINKMILNEVKNKDVCNSSTDYLEKISFLKKRKHLYKYGKINF